MYEANTIEVVKKRLLENIPETFSKLEGTFIHDLSAATAIEQAQIYAKLDEVLSLGFAQNSIGNYIDLRAAEHGVIRKSSVKATGQVKLTGIAGTIIPLNSLFATKSGVNFKTTESGEIALSGIGYINIEAVEAGSIGNVPTSSIDTIPVSISGVSTVINLSGTTGGADIESDTEFLNRFLENVRNPSRSGNSFDYIKWAKDVAGVSDARCIPVWNGAGTVKVVLIDSDKLPADNATITRTADYIETVRPIGAEITIVSAIQKNINITAKLLLRSGYTLQNVKAVIETEVTDYLKTIAFKQDYVSITKIGGIILGTDGVFDYQDLKLNDGVSNVSVLDTEVAVKGTVVFIE